ncbi:MAG: UDP-N-acetylmuramoyl-tripeptide--D-alanyl-D-alanine ligase [Saccharospirillaceae bacterium]|nr:UDP-N-acetylmuramoyl-tripeptide--D-alanyl-D-alanine ligase [Pseudomonadales bacterium]NRB78192.1 UDP-N-acetylmuramoyl-tripeptide--D-alanyl-D-alanine ligase [Saccharospirillaceae bacterium]
MIPINIKNICELFQVHCPAALYNQNIINVTMDSRLCSKQSLFVAINGEQSDGHDFIDSAVNNGAICIVVDKNNNIKRDDVCVIAVDNTVLAMGGIAKLSLTLYKGQVVSLTGSCGKTTTKQMIASICALQFDTQATAGNFNNYIGVPLTVFSTQDQHEILVAELGANAKGEIEYLNNIVNPDIAILLNASAAHLDGFEDLESVIKTKGEIITSSHSKTKIILNKDDPSFSKWLKLSDSKQVTSFSLTDKTADIHILNALYQTDGSLIEVSVYTQVIKIQLNAPGQHIVQNALAAIAASYLLKVSNQNIINGLALFKNCAGRLQKHVLGNVTIWDDSYNANPASIKSAVDVLALQNGKKIMVLGDMAEMDSHIEQYSKQLKQYMSTRVDQLLTVGLNSNLISEHLKNAQHFNTQELLVEALFLICLKHDFKNIDIMVKGSRSAKMENVVKQFITLIQEKQDDLLVN